jgi:hypothetical protein
MSERLRRDVWATEEAGLAGVTILLGTGSALAQSRTDALSKRCDN